MSWLRNAWRQASGGQKTTIVIAVVVAIGALASTGRSTPSSGLGTGNAAATATLGATQGASPTPKPTPASTPEPTATPKPTAAPTGGDFVSGSGYRLHLNGEPHLEFWVDAQTTTGGAIGLYSFRHPPDPDLHPGDPELTFSGPISCLHVVGNQAAIGGTITQSSDPVYLGGLFLVFFIDLGFPESGQDGPDIASQTYIHPVDVGIVDFGGDFPAICPDPASTAHDAFGVRGNVVVKDGP
jgi:hypothetical protein